MEQTLNKKHEQQRQIFLGKITGHHMSTFRDKQIEIFKRNFDEDMQKVRFSIYAGQVKSIRFLR